MHVRVTRSVTALPVHRNTFQKPCAVTQKGVLPKVRPEQAPVDSKVVLPNAP